MADSASAAASYAEDHGWAVFPVQPASKDPYKGSRGFKDASCDPERVRWMFGKVSPKSNIGLSCGAPSGGLVVIDEDNKNGECGADTIHDWEAEHGELPETVTCCTPTGGMHRYYRVDREVRPSVNKELGIDIRGDGSYALLPPSVHPDTGTAYEWEFAPDEREVADADENVYAFIEHVRPENQASGKPRRNTGRIEKGGRNDELFRRGRSMLAKSPGADYDLVLAYLIGVNAIDCAEPLPEHEVEKIAASVCTVKPGMSDEAKATKAAKKAGRPRKFEHNKVARKLIDEYGACRIDGVTPAIRGEDGLYRMGWEAFDAAIIDMHDDCTESNRREVKGYIRAKAPIRRQSPWNLIAFENGVLDILTMELREIGPEDVIPNKVPHRWNPDATNDVLFHVLDRMACGDTATLMNLQEFIGICMMRSNTRMPYYPVLIGSGSNGKSTYIKLLKDVLGQENISALQPKEISAHFMGEHIVGKTANLGDDIADAYLDGEDCGAIKRISTGENIFTDVKGTKGFYFEPYCTMVFSCNAFPRCKDTTEGFLRRLFPIEFNAKFSADDPDFDPLIGEKLREESALEYACMVGVEGLRRAIAQNQPTPNRMSGEVKSNIASESNTALQWFNDARLTREDIAGKTKEEVYNEYHAWCERNGYGRTAMSSGTLAAQIGTFWHMKCTGTDHRTYATGRKTVRVFE